MHEKIFRGGKEYTESDQRRLFCFLVLTLIELVILPYYILGGGGRTTLPFQVMSYVQAAVFLGVEAGVWMRKLSVKTGLGILLVTIFTRLVAETGVYTYDVSPVSYDMIIGNMVMCVAGTIFTIISRLRLLPIGESICTIVCFLLCILATQNAELTHTAWYFGILFCAVLLLSIVNYRQLANEKSWAQKMQGISGEEIKVIDLLSTTQNLGADKTQSLIDRLNDNRREQIVENVSSYLNQESRLTNRLETLCPELTNTELEICRLILKGKTLKEMCAETGKDKSTISSHRSHIRKKLGMKREDNLVRFLQKNT